MKIRPKKYTHEAETYARRLRERGYSVRFNWVDGNHYIDVVVRGRATNGEAMTFTSPREAMQYVRKTPINI